MPVEMQKTGVKPAPVIALGPLSFLDLSCGQVCASGSPAGLGGVK